MLQSIRTRHATTFPRKALTRRRLRTRLSCRVCHSRDIVVRVNNLTAASITAKSAASRDLIFAFSSAVFKISRSGSLTNKAVTPSCSTDFMLLPSKSPSRPRRNGKCSDSNHLDISQMTVASVIRPCAFCAQMRRATSFLGISTPQYSSAGSMMVVGPLRSCL